MTGAGTSTHGFWTVCTDIASLRGVIERQREPEGSRPPVVRLPNARLPFLFEGRIRDRVVVVTVQDRTLTSLPKLGCKCEGWTRESVV